MHSAGGSRRVGGLTRAQLTRLPVAAVLAGVLALGAGPSFAAPDSAQGEGQQAQPAPAQPVDPAPIQQVPLTGLGPGVTEGAATIFAPVWVDPAVVPEPPVNDSLPPEVDDKGEFAQQISCDPVDRPGVIAFALLVSDHYQRSSFYGARPCIDYASFHHDGRALDWPLAVWDTNDRMVGDSVATWLTANNGEMAQRFGMEYFIWNGLIWYADGRGWEYYNGNPHTDHMHFSFTWDGAQMRTSWWTGVAVTEPDRGPCDVTPWSYAAIHQYPRLEPCDTAHLAPAPSTGLIRVRPGEYGGGVSLLQGTLGLPQTGVLDEATRAALLAWQDDQHVPQTGVLDDFTYAVLEGMPLGEVPTSAMAVAPRKWQQTEFSPYKRTTLTLGDEGKAVKVLQEAIGASPDGSFGPKTAKAVADWEKTVPELALQSARRSDGPVTITPLTWIYLERAAHPTIFVRELELSIGSLDQSGDQDGLLAAAAIAEDRGSPYAGGAVTLLQGLLGVKADGSFGPKTQAAVQEVQESAKLEPTGLVDGPTWAAIEGLAIEQGRAAGAPGAEAAREAAEKAEKKAEQAKAKAAKKAEEAKKAEAAAHARAVADVG